MVAYEGFVQYEPNPPAVRQIAKDWMIGEGAPLMKCPGDGLLYLADYGANVVSSTSTATDLRQRHQPARLRRPSDRGAWSGPEGPGEAPRAGPVEHQDIPGQGWAGASPPGVRRSWPTAAAARTKSYVDPDALVAWSPNLKVK